jgi:uncharacterized membrane protein
MLRKFFHKVAVLAVVAAAIALPGKAAHADLKFTNHFQTPIYVLIGWYDENSCGSFDPWRAKGWYRVDRGQTATLFYGDLTHVGRYWYYYAMSEDRSFVWEGDYYFFVNPDAAFDICDTPGPGVDKLGFREMDLNGFSDYTMTLY